MSLDPQKLRISLEHDVAVYAYEELDSTNNEAKRQVVRDSGSAALYIADSQSTGRGRLGRSFYSPSDSGLYMTLSLPVNGGISGIQRLTCAAAVAVCEALYELSPLSPRIKWVNDIYIGSRKVCGILAELITDEDNHPSAVIIGIGVNLTTASFPDELADKAGTVGDIEPEALCAGITDRLMDMYYGDGGYMERYADLCFVPGQDISYSDRDGVHHAHAIGISPDGGLIIIEDGVQKTLSYGEISVRATENS